MILRCLHKKMDKLYFNYWHMILFWAISVIFRGTRKTHCNEIDLAWNFVFKRWPIATTQKLLNRWTRGNRKMFYPSIRVKFTPFKMKINLIILIRQKYRNNRLSSFSFCFVSNCLLSFYGGNDKLCLPEHKWGKKLCHQRPGARFSKLPVIIGPVRQFCFSF